MQKGIRRIIVHRCRPDCRRRFTEKSATIPEVDCVRKALSDKKKGLGSGTQQFGTADVLANDDSPDDCEILAFARTQGVIALH
ncbi:uncharacterized protein LOC108849037 isoform X4 [Raphanus sativus]|uniref:Uncharacterized protein LOC108849037 isoform X4 n=1 Tax=Raphanus sativus TaxID=3726 RepID=A0A6J0MZY2_RAPSA|nr:uncharacterized protein LOC108849037 isoform X4 [Raphanus sativus]